MICEFFVVKLRLQMLEAEQTHIRQARVAARPHS
jgi:hypothetical protein